MALISNSTYGYVDLSGNQVFVNTASLTDMGTWSPSPTYAVLNVVLYASALYVCLASNTNVAPSGNASAQWSTLVIVQQGGGGGGVTAQEAYDLAERALEVAETGTAAVDDILLNNIPALRAVSVPDPSKHTFRVLRYLSTVGDGRGGLFTWFSGDSTDDDGDSAIAVTANGSNPGRFIRLSMG